MFWDKLASAINWSGFLLAVGVVYLILGLPFFLIAWLFLR